LGHGLRNTTIALVLLVGIVWSLPMETGRIDTHPEPAAYSAADPAEFKITSYRNALLIVGHSRSKHHEQRIIESATTHFPSHSARAEFRPLGIAPAWWDAATLELVAVIAGTESPSAYLAEGTLRIRALVADNAATERRLLALRERLPRSTVIDVHFTVVDTDVNPTTICEQQFAVFRVDPVAFEESGTAMRASAYPALDRVVALADACRAATLTITGHTDSSGNETWNQRLSLARAESVAAHLGSRGIAADRLAVVGAGSSVPVADNTTRYGRSMNRRIDIRFTASSD